MREIRAKPLESEGIEALGSGLSLYSATPGVVPSPALFERVSNLAWEVRARCARDPSLRLKNSYAQDDALQERFVTKFCHYQALLGDGNGSRVWYAIMSRPFL